MKKLRPVDMLIEVLVESNGPDSEAVKSYFVSQTEPQACATCLILACNQSSQNIQVSFLVICELFNIFMNYVGRKEGSSTIMNSSPI